MYVHKRRRVDGRSQNTSLKKHCVARARRCGPSKRCIDRRYHKNHKRPVHSQETTETTKDHQNKSPRVTHCVVVEDQEQPHKKLWGRPIRDVGRNQARPQPPNRAGSMQVLCERRRCPSMLVSIALVGGPNPAQRPKADTAHLLRVLPPALQAGVGRQSRHSWLRPPLPAGRSAAGRKERGRPWGMCGSERRRKRGEGQKAGRRGHAGSRGVHFGCERIRGLRAGGQSRVRCGCGAEPALVAAHPRQPAKAQHPR